MEGEGGESVRVAKSEPVVSSDLSIVAPLLVAGKVAEGQGGQREGVEAPGQDACLEGRGGEGH